MQERFHIVKNTSAVCGDECAEETYRAQTSLLSDGAPDAFIHEKEIHARLFASTIACASPKSSSVSNSSMARWYIGIRISIHFAPEIRSTCAPATSPARSSSPTAGGIKTV